MAKIVLITLNLTLLLLSLTGCTSQLMNGKTYGQISIGMSSAEARKIAGEPYRITREPYGENYEYVERFEIGPNAVNQNTYILCVRDGIVIDKHKTSETPRMNFSTP